MMSKKSTRKDELKNSLWGSKGKIEKPLPDDWNLNSMEDDWNLSSSDVEREDKVSDKQLLRKKKRKQQRKSRKKNRR
jgi:hypothetical protein